MKVDESRIKKQLFELMKINSENPPGNEEEIAEYASSVLLSLGFKIKRIDAARKRATILGESNPSAKKSLLYAAHLDTVPFSSAQQEPFERDGKIFGRGSVDDKGPLASVLEAARIFVEGGGLSQTNSNLIVGGFADEENGSNLGVKHVISKSSQFGFNPTYSVVTEATGFKIGIGEKGVVRMRISCKGVEAHSSKPETGINAIYMQSALIEKLRKKHFTNGESQAFSGGSTVNVGVIRGGAKQSIVAGECTIDVDFRLVPGQSRETIERDLEDVFNEVKKDQPDFNASLDVYRYDLPHLIDENQEFVSLLKSACVENSVSGQTYVESGATIAKFLNLAGFPAVVCGPGDTALCHCSNEAVLLRDLVKGAQVYIDYARKVL